VLQVNEHMPLWQTGCACSTFVVHAWPHIAQWLVLWLVSTQLPLQSVGIDAGHPVAQAYVVPEPAQTGLAAGQVVPQAPQFSGLERSVSQPSSGFDEQCPHGDAHAVGANPHLPALQVTVPLTCGSVVQSWPHVPQL
jgi:hypothetical protein